MMIKRAIGWTMMANLNAIFLQMLQLFILARLLSPADFGIIAISSAVCMLVITLQDMGLSGYVIYKQDITKNELSSLYWFSILVGFLLFLSFSGLSPYIAKYYSNNNLLIVFFILSFNFIAIASNAQIQALCLKNYQFDYIAKLDLFSKWIVLITTVLSAYFNMGAACVAFGMLCGNFYKTILLYGQKREFRPKFYLDFNDIKPAISYGAYQLGGQIINSFALHLDNLILGKLIAPSALGFYSLSKDLSIKASSLVNPVVNKMALPALSKAQSSIVKCTSIYLTNLRLVSSLNALGYSFIAIFSTGIVNVLYGEKYLICAQYLGWLSIFGLFRCCINPIGSLLQATGNTKYEFQWNFINFFVSSIFISVAAYWGVDWVVIANVATQMILLILVYVFILRKVILLRFREYLNALFPGVLYILIVVVFNKILEHDIFSYKYMVWMFMFSCVFLYLIWLCNDVVNIFRKING